MVLKKIISGIAGSIFMAISMPLATHATPTTVVVTPANAQGWSTADTRPGGTVTTVTDASSPLPDGALNLKTDATTTAKAQYMHAAETPLAGVSQLGYSAKQNSASFDQGTASYQLAVDLNGAAAGGFTTFVFEPYQNGYTVVEDAWQTYDVDAGQFWSSRSFSEGTCTVVAGGGGAPFYTLAGLQENCPNAVVVGYGVNIGSNNPSYDINVDKFVFNDTTYDFQKPIVLANKEACKNEGWKTSEAPMFKNQGDCVSYFASNGKAKGNPVVLSNNPTF